MTSCLHHIIFVHILWTRRSKFLRITQQFAAKTARKMEDHVILPKWSISSIVIFFLLIAILTTAQYRIHRSPADSGDSFFGVFHKLRASFFEMRCNLELHPEKFVLVEDSPNLLWNWKVIASYPVIFVRVLLSCSTDCLISVMVLGLYSIVRNFTRKLDSQEDKKAVLRFDIFQDLLQEYENLGRLVDAINHAISRLVLTYVLETVFFYSVYLKELAALDGYCLYLQF